MIEWLGNNVLYWHWIVFGLALITFELFAPVFVMLWLGSAAVIVGIVGLIIPINFTLELIIWALLSTLFIYLWHRFISPKLVDRTTAGQTNHLRRLQYLPQRH